MDVIVILRPCQPPVEFALVKVKTRSETTGELTLVSFGCNLERVRVIFTPQSDIPLDQLDLERAFNMINVSAMLGVKQVRNKKLLPDLQKEGELTKEIVLSTKEKHGVPAGSRLFSHHTLASVRKLSFFHPFFLPEDSLDLVLAATYNHSTEEFADKEDLYLQPETIGCETWRRLRNVYNKPLYSSVSLGHPMKRGGITEHKSPFSVKLMNSGVHSSQTNPGYSRQPAGGAIFFY